MVTRNTPNTTPQRRFPPYVPPTPPKPPTDGSDRAKLRQAQEGQQRALAAASARTQSQNAYGPSGAPSRADVQALQARNFTRNQEALFGSPSSSGTTGTTGTAGPVDNTPAPPARTFNFEDYARDFRDPEYNAQIASLNRALQDFETGTQQRAERYGIDYLQGVRNIGYRPAPGFVAMRNFLEEGREKAAPQARAIMGAQATGQIEPQGQWDIEGRFDPYSAAARGTRGLRDEFAARGTLRGTDFDRTFGEFQGRLNEQLGAMQTGRTRFEEDLESELAQQRTTTEERRQATERAAVNRANTAQMNAFMRALAGG